MLQNGLSAYERYVVNLFGFRVVIHLEEFILILAGIFLGMLIMSLLTGNFIYKLHQIDDFGKSQLKLIRITHKGKNKYIAHFKNLAETIEQILLLSFSPLFTIRRYTLRDEKRTKRFLIIMCIIAVLVIGFAILSITTVFEPQSLEQTMNQTLR